ncbi:MAG: hypothetical protein NT155_03735 [Candidatus Staskawiczbacteria bacterium]|nr:hypothetical protein [Candidatus Staskawiczbacteria bacterium]
MTDDISIFDLGFDKFLAKSSQNSDSFPLPAFVPTLPSSIASGEIIGNLTLVDGFIKSDNYVQNASGWKLSPDGGEFNFAVSVDSLDIPDATTANSFHVNTAGDVWWGCNNADFNANIENAIAYILKTGITKFATSLSGASIAASGSSFTLSDDSAFNAGTLPAAEDFYNTFTIVGYNITASGTPTQHLAFDQIQTRGNTGYAYKDYGAGHFNSSFTQYLTVCTTLLGASRTYAYWALSNSVGDMHDHSAGGPLPGIFLYISVQNSYPTINGIEYGGGGTFSEGNYDMTLGTPYYLTIYFNSTVGTHGTLYTKIYSDSARIHLLATRTMALGATMSYRYLYAYSSYNDGNNSNLSSGYIDTLRLGVVEPSVTGNSAQFLLPESSDMTERFIINRRKSKFSNDDGVLEIFSDKAPAGSGLDYIFIGRQGYGDSSTWNISCVDITTTARFQLVHKDSIGPAFQVFKTADSSNVGDGFGGLGTAGAIREIMAYQPSNSFNPSNRPTDIWNILTDNSGGGGIAFGYWDRVSPFWLQMWIDAAGIHFGDNLDFTYAGTITGGNFTGWQAGSVLYKSADTSRDVSLSASNVKYKDISTTKSGTIRVEFNLLYVNRTITAQIYKNGVAYGTVRTVSSGNQTFTEDLSFSAGDSIQLYAYPSSTGTGGCYVRYFRLYVAGYESATVVLD